MSTTFPRIPVSSGSGVSPDPSSMPPRGSPSRAANPALRSRPPPRGIGAGQGEAERMDRPPDPLEMAATTRPDAPSVIVDSSGGARESVTTNAELDALVNRLANGLRDVVAPGERLVWCGPNSLEVL